MDPRSRCVAFRRPVPGGSVGIVPSRATASAERRISISRPVPADRVPRALSSRSSPASSLAHTPFASDPHLRPAGRATGAARAVTTTLAVVATTTTGTAGIITRPPHPRAAAAIATTPTAVAAVLAEAADSVPSPLPPA